MNTVEEKNADTSNSTMKCEANLKARLVFIHATKAFKYRMELTRCS